MSCAGFDLDGWKAIMEFFLRSERTVKAWRALHGMPVHKYGPRGVCANKAELLAWRATFDARCPSAPTQTVAPTIAETTVRVGARRTRKRRIIVDARQLAIEWRLAS